MNMQANVNSQLQTESPKEQLVNALLKCTAIKNDDTRKEIANTLEEKFACQIKYSPGKKLHVETIFDCMRNQPDGMRVLLHKIREYDGKDSITAKDVENLYNQLFHASQSNGSRAIDLLTSQVLHKSSSDDLMKYARKIHFDTDMVVEMFVNMVKDKNNPEFYKVLGIKGPKEIGFNSLVERLQEICKNKLSSSFPIICVDYSIQERTFEAIAYGILDRIKYRVNEEYQKNPAKWEDTYSKAKHLHQKLKELISLEVKEERNRSPQISGTSNLEYHILSNYFQECLQDFLIDKNFLVVIFLKNFDLGAPSTKEWLKYWLCNEAWGCFGKLIVVVTGSKLEFLDFFKDKHCTLLKPKPELADKFFMDWLKECDYEWVTSDQYWRCKRYFEASRPGESIYPDNFRDFLNVLKTDKEIQLEKKVKQVD